MYYLIHHKGTTLVLEIKGFYRTVMYAKSDNKGNLINLFKKYSY